MMTILTPITEWECPACGLTDQTREAKPHSRMHTCPKMHGLTAPMVRAGTKAKLEIHEREDFVGSESVQTDDRGRPVMNITTTRDDGQDVTVRLRPTAGQPEASSTPPDAHTPAP